ncbi:hypothetical protein K2173_027203 [Erythroxylum novogranatense]|uniref:Uncharacterized protein n=1 Tax=Erythroxylum novogranatense TaxID=1862640 RepID=A0AAV8TYG0_9ROSI|nr:hypothetical protein K2173_027203 [Erythroxylum novogranatense]
MSNSLIGSSGGSRKSVNIEIFGFDMWMLTSGKRETERKKVRERQSKIRKQACQVKPRKIRNLTIKLTLTSKSRVSFEGSVFDPLGISSDAHYCLNTAWDGVLAFLSPILDSNSSTKRDKSSARRVVAAIEDSSIDFGDFFKGPLPGKCLKLLGFLALSRLGIYIPLGGVNREAFAGNLDQNSLLSTWIHFLEEAFGRLGICSLGIVPFINAQIVFQLLAQIYPKLRDLQKREGEAGRKKILQYTRYASVGFAIGSIINPLSSCQSWAEVATR